MYNENYSREGREGREGRESREGREGRDKESSLIPKFKKKCIFCKNGDSDINYKNIDMLGRYVSAKGKIISRRISGNCAKHQRKLTQEIKITRFLSLIPYVMK